MNNYAEEPNTGTSAGLSPREQFLADLYNLVQTVRVYQENNQMVDAGVENFRNSLEDVVGYEGNLELRIENAHFYFFEEKLGLRKDRKRAMDIILAYFEERALVGLTINIAANLAPKAELVCFATLLNNCKGKENPSEWLRDQLSEASLEWVTPTEIATSEEGQDGEEEILEVEPEKKMPEVAGKRSPRKVYAYTLKAVQDVVKKISSKEKVGIRKTVRMVQTMAEEILLQEEPLMLAMSTIKAYDDYTFTHSVNVAILAMYIGKSLGLPKETLERLGLCGVFHDLGKIVWPHELLNKVEEFDADDFKIVHQHSLNSTRIIVQQLTASIKSKSRMLLPAFEHHLKYDLTGYPNIGWKRPISLCGRIITIADVYDALTSPRVYRPEALSPDTALGLMLQGAGTAFDPVLLKVFINTLGLYPVGTLLILDGGEFALVTQRASSEDISRPMVLLLEATEDGDFIKGEALDLSAKDSTGRYIRKIKDSLNPITHNIQPAKFLTLPH